MKITRMNVLENSNSKTKAFFDIETAEGFIVKGFKLVEGPSGLFVGSPSDKGKDGKWHDQVTVPAELKEELQNMAMKEYEEKK